MPNDPKYVMLANRLTGGILADIEGSGWSISGLDVKEFPSTDGAARFVRHALREGKLEPSSRSEFDEVQALHGDVSKVPGHQESKLMGEAMRANRKLAESRGLDDEDEDDTEDWAKTRSEEQDDETDDPEEQAARNKQRPVAKKKKSKNGKSGKKSKSADEEPS